MFQIRKDISDAEKVVQQNSTSGCINRNGHLCIGLCITVILYYMFSDSSHLLSFALISIFDLLNLVVSLYQYLFHNCKMTLINSSLDRAHALNYTKAKSYVSALENNSDNNFQIQYKDFQHTEVDRIKKLSCVFEKFSSKWTVNLVIKFSSNVIALQKKLMSKPVFINVMQCVKIVYVICTIFKGSLPFYYRIRSL